MNECALSYTVSSGMALLDYNGAYLSVYAVCVSMAVNQIRRALLPLTLKMAALFSNAAAERPKYKTKATSEGL